MFVPMRLLALALAALALGAGCAGSPDARQAYDLLERAQAEQKTLSSAGYELKLSADMGAQKFSFRVAGAAQLKGANAGDQYLRIRAAVPTGAVGAGDVDMWMVKRGSRVTVSFGGQAQTFDAARAGAPDLDAWGSFGSLDFASCVKRVGVEPGRSLNGEPVTRIGGVVDTVCILRAASKMSGLSKAAGQPFDLDDLATHVEDVRATLFVSDRSHLLVGGVIATTVSAEGQTLDLQLSYRLTEVNKPLRFPPGF
jgi:hypothetical protein